MTDTVLRMSEVTKTYPGVVALDQMNLDCIAGEVHAVLGENGSGKSTLLKTASGSVTPDSGTDPHKTGINTMYSFRMLVMGEDSATTTVRRVPPKSPSNGKCYAFSCAFSLGWAFMSPATGGARWPWT